MSLKLEPGKFYRTRWGVKVGPLTGLEWGFFIGVLDGERACWGVDGAMFLDRTSPHDLVAEWDGPSCSLNNEQSTTPNSSDEDPLPLSEYITDEDVVARFNELVKAGRVQFSEARPARPGSRWLDQDAEQRLKPAEPRKLTLPDSKYEVVVKDGRVYIGCQDFGPVTNFLHVLTYLVNGSAVQNSDYHDPISSTRQGLLHRKGKITWRDADALLEFLEEAAAQGSEKTKSVKRSGT